MPGNDARLNDGLELFILDRIRNIDFPFAEQFAQLMAASIARGDGGYGDSLR